MTVIVEEAAVEAGAPARAKLRLVRDFLHRPLGVVSAAFLLIVVLAVALAPLVAPYDPLAQDLRHTLALPSASHPLGTDRLGRDVLSRLLYGGQVSLIGLVEALAVAFVIGIVGGLLAGYLGGLLDNVLSRLTEIVMAIPGIVVLLMVYSITDNNPHAGMITLGVLSAPTIIRVTRAAAQAVREEVFVSASRVLGMSRFRIMFQHVLPNIWGPIIVNTAVLGAVVLGIQGGLNYINLGINPPDPSWGGMVSDAEQVIAQQAWLILPSGLTLALVIMALMLVADALRDATAASRGGSGSTKRAVKVVAGSGHESPPPDPESILSVRGLTVAFGGLVVVRDVDFDVRTGETIGIVGESGCGKTVTASAVLGSLGSDATVSGSVVFDQVDLNHSPKSARVAVRGSGIAYVSQDPMVALDPCFTVASQLGELVGRHDHVRGAKRRHRVLELLEQVGLPDPADVARRFPHELSGGMAQRVAIACALSGRPKLLLADEPTTALDVTIQGEILGLLRRLQDETGMAIVLITHDLGVVADLCSRVVVMYAGEVCENTDVEALFATATHPYTKALVEANPIMAVPRTRLHAIPGTVPTPAMWPVGCHFYDRCPFHVDACAAGPIPLLDLGRPGEHAVRCIRLDEIAAALRAEEVVA